VLTAKRQLGHLFYASNSRKGEKRRDYRFFGLVLSRYVAPRHATRYLPSETYAID